MQSNFWTLHKIMCYNTEKDSLVVQNTVSDLVSLMNQKVGKDLDIRSYMNFLYNFRNYFQSIFFTCEDEKILLEAVVSL